MENTIQQISFIAVLAKGGWVMIPLIACSIIALAIIIERLIYGPRKSRVIPRGLVEEVIELIHSGRHEQITSAARAKPSPLSRIVVTATNNAHRSRGDLVDLVQMAGKKEAEHLTRFLNTLGTIATIGPLLGLLGTVFGIMKTFDVIGQIGTANAQRLAAGIGEALVATATGLVVAIPSAIAHRYLMNKARILVSDMEDISFRVVDSLTRREEDSNVAILDTSVEHRLKHRT